MKSKLHNDDKLTCHKLLIALKPAASCFFHRQFQEKHLLANIVLPEVDVTVCPLLSTYQGCSH